MRWIVTGGAGFIGSRFVRTALGQGWADEVVVLDALTYAGNLKNLDPVVEHPGYRFHRVDIADPAEVAAAVGKSADVVFHFEMYGNRGASQEHQGASAGA